VLLPYRRAAAFALTLAPGLAVVAEAQPSTDSAAQHDSSPVRVWLSLGAGGGSSSRGGIAGRAAATVAVSPMLAFTLAGTSVGGIDGSIDSMNLMAGVQSSDPGGFVFVSAGLANTSCGSGCPNRTGIAFDGGYHFGGRYAGVGLVGFIIRAPERSNASGVVLSIDVGWFDRRFDPSKGSSDRR